MANKKIMLGILGITLVFGAFVAGCSSSSSSSPIRPSLSQTVINIQRGSTSLDSDDLYIYIDDRIINEKSPIEKGKVGTFQVNNGVHYIHGVCGKLVSEAINFSANYKTVSFVATIEKEPGFFGKKTLIISRSTVSDDTGSQTDLDIQESYGDL